MLRFAFNNLWHKRSRTLLALVGLGIAVVGFICLVSLSAGLRYTITESISKVQGVLVLEEGTFSPAFSSVELSWQSKIEALPETARVAPLIMMLISTVDGEKGMSGLSQPPLLMGVDINQQAGFKGSAMPHNNMKRGRFLKSGDRFSTVMGPYIKDTYHKEVGQTIDVNGVRFKIVGEFETGSDLFDHDLIIPIDVARELSGKDAGKASLFFVEPQNSQDAKKLVDKINFVLPRAKAYSTSDFAASFGSLLSMIDVFFLAVSSLALFIGVIGVLNTMLMSVMDRFREFGILRAIGWTKANLMSLVVLESFYLGIIGGIGGCIVSLGATRAMDAILTFNTYTTPELLLTGFVLSVMLGVFGGLYPAWHASKMDPVQAIRYE